MTSAMAAVFLAAALPTRQELSSAAVAYYWLKKDEQGNGDEIAERQMPRRYAAFAAEGDTFLVRDPFVRAKHLDRIEISFAGKRYSAREVARTGPAEAVVLKTDRPVEGVTPLVFTEGEIARRLTWRWEGDSLCVESAKADVDSRFITFSSGGRTFRRGMANTVYVDAEGRPVCLDLGATVEAPDGRFDFPPPGAWNREPADSFEKAAVAVEEKASRASLCLTIHLNSDDSQPRHSNDSESDAVGYVIDGRVFVPSVMTSDKIARIKDVVASFPDGSTGNLVFAGALAEWDAMVFDLPECAAGKVGSFEINETDPATLHNEVVWALSIDNQNGSIVSDAKRFRVDGLEMVREAGFVPRIPAKEDSQSRMTVDSEGRILSMRLSRRFKMSGREGVTASELASFVAGKKFNPQFVPREQDDRKSIAWLGIESVELTEALSRERKAQTFYKKYRHPPYVTEVYPGSPAEKAGIATGDILLAVRRPGDSEIELVAETMYGKRDWGAFFSSDASIYDRSGLTPWPDIENKLNRIFTFFGSGASVEVIYARDGKRRSATAVLENAPVHFATAARSRNRSLGLSIRDLTFEVRRFFSFADGDPGVVIAKVKPGSPAAIAGLRPYELVTEVNGEKVYCVGDFAAAVKGRSDFVFAVRRLSQRRMVKIQLNETNQEEK